MSGHVGVLGRAVGALALVAGLLACAPVRAEPGSPARSALLAQPLGSDPAQAWHLPAALRWLDAEHAAEGADPDDAEALWRGLLARYLALAAGEAVDPAETVGQVLAAGRQARAVEAQAELRLRWRRALDRQLLPQWPAGEVALPDDLQGAGTRLRTLAPGVWTFARPGGPPGVLLWQLHLRNAALALAPGDLEVQLEGAALPGLRMHCAWPRVTGPQLLAAGSAQALLCQSEPAVDAADRRLPALAAQLAHGDGLVLRLGSADLDDTAAAHRMTARLAPGAGQALADFQRANASCERRGRCAAELQARREQVAEAQARGESARSRLLGRLLGPLGLLLGFGLFCLLASALGRRSAQVITGVLVLAGVAGLALQVVPGVVHGPVPDAPSFGALIIPLVFLGAALVLPFLLAAVYGFGYEICFGDREAAWEAFKERWLRNAYDD